MGIDSDSQIMMREIILQVKQEYSAQEALEYLYHSLFCIRRGNEQNIRLYVATDVFFRQSASPNYNGLKSSGIMSGLIAGIQIF